MTSQLRLFISESHNAYFNLAVEESIFRKMDPSQKVLFLWRNADVVVIGRAQNPWKECNTGKMEEDGIMLARRQSGGGAVYQDLGNSCFTFMAGKPGYNKEISTEIVLNALHKLDVPAKASGRNDLVIETDDGERKISGSAYKESVDRGFHHGTIMLNVDLTKLMLYLNPDPKKLQAKGITSVRSRVTNIQDLYPNITNDKLTNALIEAYFEYYNQDVEIEYISPENMPNLPGFEAQFKHQQSWEWNFGSVMPFTHKIDERFPWGGIELCLEVNQAIIRDARLYSDSLVLEPLDAIEKSLIGLKYTSAEISSVFSEIIHKHPNFKIELNEIKNLIINEVK